MTQEKRMSIEVIHISLKYVDPHDLEGDAIAAPNVCCEACPYSRFGIGGS
jgi:hypothetical protein